MSPVDGCEGEINAEEMTDRSFSRELKEIGAASRNVNVMVIREPNGLDE